jgi:O-antigen/teichoic acid export membrane protein
MKSYSKSLYKQLFEDSFYYFLTKIIPGITGLFSVSLFIRWVGSDEYGKFSLIISFVMAIGALSSGWLNQSILRYYSIDKKKKSFFESIFYGILISFSISFLILFTTNKLILKLDFIALFVTYFSLISVILFRLKSSLLQANLQAYQIAKMTSLQSSLALLLPLLIFIKYDYHLGLLIGVSLSYFLTGYIKNIFKKPIIPIMKNLDSLRKYHKFGLPISFRISIGLLIPFIDKWFVMFFFNDSTTGLYSGYSEVILKIFSIILFPITLAIHPLVTKYWNDGKKNNALILIKKGIGIHFLIFIFSILILFSFRESFFILIQKFIPGLTINFKELGIPIFISGFLWQLSLLVHKPLELAEKPIYMVCGILISLSVSVIGNILLIPKIGLIAISLNSVFSAAAYIIVVIIFIIRDKTLA